MKPIKLNTSFNYPTPCAPDSCPVVHLNDLGIDLPWEGEIRFRYSLVRRTEVDEGTPVSFELKLKAVTDVCDCEGKDEENNEPRTEKTDSGDVLDDLMKDYEEEEEEDEED